LLYEEKEMNKFILKQEKNYLGMMPVLFTVSPVVVECRHDPILNDAEYDHCSICESEIAHDSIAYSLDLNNEYLDGDAYSVKDSCSYMAACIDCYQKHSIKDSVDTMLESAFCAGRELDGRDKKAHTSNCHDDCSYCGEHIIDGSDIFTVNHSIEQYVSPGVRQPLDVTFDIVLCTDCHEETGFAELVIALVDDFIERCQAENLEHA
jgi:hypothetical protein